MRIGKVIIPALIFLWLFGFFDSDDDGKTTTEEVKATVESTVNTITTTVEEVVKEHEQTGVLVIAPEQKEVKKQEPTQELLTYEEWEAQQKNKQFQ